MLAVSKLTRPLISQRIAMATALMPRARAEAKKRQRSGKRALFTACAAEVAAASVGWSRATLMKALAVTNAAKRDRRKFGDLLARMDETGRVDRAYRQMRVREGKPQSDRSWRKEKTRLHDVLLQQLGELSIDKAETEIANCRIRIEILEALIAEAHKVREPPPRRRRFLNMLPVGNTSRVIASVQKKHEHQ